MQTFIRGGALGLALWAQSALLPSVALACGGFFCNRAQPVNQAAEGIIFADNGDGTTTAVIQILYQGPSKSFSWLLPISSAPKNEGDIGIASNLAFQRLQLATNPNYVLNTKIEGSCAQEPTRAGSLGGSPSGAGGASSAAPGGVTVEASGVVGSFEWTVISVDSSNANPADTAVAWLQDNGYDVPSGSPKLLAQYLQSGMHLLALKLTKGADTGSIRPIVLTYAGSQPSIPIKLTAVAANADMGVLTWVLGKSRAVPQNYLSLELNEARINWFNANSNYNAVVTAAANDAGGQGFVTEFAGATDTLASQIWTAADDASWAQLQTQKTPATFYQMALLQFGRWDGFWDATRVAVTLPEGLTLDQLKSCTNCYTDQLSFVPADYLAELEKMVIEPVKRVQKLISLHPEITRMYTTMSADEMTLDPLFAFNEDLPAVSNQHRADRIVECNPNVYMSTAPWRIELPQGGVVRGVGSTGAWPAALGELPPNRVIVRAAASGAGKVIEDNSSDIKTQLDDYNSKLAMGAAGTTGNTGVAGAGAIAGMGPTAGGGVGVVMGAGAGNRLPDEGSGGVSNGAAAKPSAASGGCSFARSESPLFALFTAGVLGAVVARRRRRC